METIEITESKPGFVIEDKPYFKMDRTKKYNLLGFARGVNEALDAGHKGIIITDKYGGTYVLVYSNTIPNRVRGWGDRTLFNYLASMGTAITATQVSLLNDEEDTTYALVTLEEIK